MPKCDRGTAVESAGYAVVQPNHSRATLGTVLGEIGNPQGKLTVAIADTDRGPGDEPLHDGGGEVDPCPRGFQGRHGGGLFAVPGGLTVPQLGFLLSSSIALAAFPSRAGLNSTLSGRSATGTSAAEAVGSSTYR